MARALQKSALKWISRRS